MLNMKNTQNILKAFFYFALLSSCAKEVSDEDRRREETDRELRRLESAEGDFSGLIEVAPRRGVPFVMSILATRNPQANADTPTLTATLSLGFFGGVSLVAERVGYDWGSGKITAVFGKLEVELDGLKDKKSFERGTITGSKLGQRSLIAIASNSIEQSAREYMLPMSFRGGESSQTALLNIKRTSADIDAPEFSDLSTLPPLQSAIRLSNVSQVLHALERTWFDPLAGTIDLQIRNDSWIRISDVFASLEESDQGLVLEPAMKSEFFGAMYLGGQAVTDTSFSFDTARLNMGEYAPRKVPRFFTGTYKGSESGLTLKMYASLDDSGGVMQNPSELEFSNVPDLRLRLVRCMDGSPINTIVLKIFSLDYLRSKLVFTDVNGSAQRLTTINVNQDWQLWNGSIIDNATGSDGIRNAVFTLQAAANQSAEPRCNQI
jgi:hypothetical protein